MSAPRVSVVIPAYNNAAYTTETVESVLAQTYRDFELIVVDDGSTDHTREAMAAYADRIQYVYKENGGACRARNLGLGRARGKLVACLDCDDLWLPDHLERSVAALEARQDQAMVFGPSYLIDGEGRKIGVTNYKFDLDRAYVDLLHENFIVAPSVVMRRACLERVGPFDERIFIPADWDLWLRLARQYPIGYIDAPTAQYRMVSNYTLRHVEQYVDETQYVLAKHLDGDAIDQALHRKIKSRFNINYATLYREKGDMGEARLRLRQAIKSDPSSWAAYGHLGLSYMGIALWRLADRAKDRLWGGWMLKRREGA